MGSRPWRRSCVPPMPALIPIAALRNKSASTVPSAGQQCTQPLPPAENNNDSGPGGHPACVPCERSAANYHREPASQRVDSGSDELDSEDDDEVRCSADSGADDCMVPREGGGELPRENEERLRRPMQQPATPARRRRSAIDETPSRDADAVEQAPARRPRPERHRKSDRRRREHRSDRLLRKRSTSGNGTAIPSTTTTTIPTTNTASGHSSDQRQPPRVNPIFVWIRQEDTRIVDVRCEDYDKRNRILLTKTAHGWRAIPRTETLATTLEETPASAPHHHEHRHERGKSGPGRPRGRKNGRAAKKRRPSSDERPDSPSKPSQDIESHLPSHTITVPKRHRTKTSSPARPPSAEVPSDDSVPTEVRDDDDIEEAALDSDSVNSLVAQAPQCRVSSSVSPLDKLLAVAEIAFKNQVNGELSSPIPEESDDYKRLSDAISENDVVSEAGECASQGGDTEHSVTDKIAAAPTDDCDYDEDDEDESNFSHVLDKLERSLQSPVEIEDEPDEDVENPEQEAVSSEIQEDVIEDVEIEEEVEQAEVEELQEHEEVEELLTEVEKVEEEQQEVEEDEEDEEEMEASEDYDSVTEKSQDVDAQQDACEQPADLTVMNILEDELLPTDLSTHSKKTEQADTPNEVVLLDDMPTDLSIRKHSNPGLTIEPIIRPPSQNSETIQSPQPSGIPAVPPSPDILPISKQTNNKSVFLESLLSASPKLSLNPELTITRNQKEPLDLGKGRKSASPTVTCSEEAKNMGEPSPKRLKIEDITLKNLLHAEDKKPEIIIKPVPVEKKKSPTKDQSSRLLELLTAETVPDAMTQLKQLLADPHINIPDPMLVPKDRLSHILAAPAKEIPRLLMTRPELRLPEVFGHPTLMNDPDILVITMDQLHIILEKHLQPISLEESKAAAQKEQKMERATPEKIEKHQLNKSSSRTAKNSQSSIAQQAIANDYHRYVQNLQHQQQLMLQEAQMKHHQSQMMRKGSLANDIDAATTASFNQMMWLPYLNQLEQAAQATGNNQDFLKMLNAVFPNGGYPGHSDHVTPMFNAGRFGLPNAMPMQPPIDYGNHLEVAMWQEAMLRQKMPQAQESSLALAKHAAAYRENIEKRNHQMSLGNKNKINQRHNSSQHLGNGHHNSVSLMNNGQHMLNGHHNNIINSLVQQQQLQQQQMQQQQLQQQRSQTFSSARTNPIQHMTDQQLISAGIKNPFMRSTSLGSRTSNLQVPHYNSALAQAASQKPTLQRSQSMKEAQFAEKPPFGLNKPSMKQSNPFYGPKESNLQKQPELKIPPPRLQGRSIPQSPRDVPRTAGEPHKPIDLSGTKPTKFKMRPNILAPNHFMSHRPDEIAEVGSTTEEGGHLHDTQTHHVWHPLFGK